MKLKFALMAVCVLAAIFAAGCTQQTDTEEVKIGVVASMTGPASTTGKDIWQSAVLAADEINAKGGIYVESFGKKIPIRLIQGDDESTREGGQKAVSKLITQDGVDLLVGGFSSAVVSAHQSIVAEYKVPYIITGGSSTAVSHRDDIDTEYMFFHRPSTDDSSGATILFVDEVLRPAINAKFGFEDTRPLRLAIVYQDSPYGKGQQTAIHSTVEANDLLIEVVSEESFKMGESDFRTTLTSVKAAKPDALYAATFLNELIPLIQQGRRDVGLDTIYIAIEPNDDPDYYSGVGTYGEYSLIESRFSPYAVPPGAIAASIQEYKDNFDEKWGGFPGMMGAATYEGVYIAANAIENCGTLEKAQVRDSLAAIEMPEMVEAMQGGICSFSDDFRESKFDLFVDQLIWDEDAGEPRPKILWPENVKEADLVLPDWYEPGTSS